MSRSFLIVDEPHELGAYLEEFKLHLGVPVFTASSRDEALPILASQNLAAVILDFTTNLPDRSSLYFELITIPKLSTTPCIFLPNRDTLRHAQKLIHRPEDQIILKPISGAVLSQETASVLRLPKRVPLELMVRVYLENQDSPFPIRGKTINVSSSGMLIRTSQSLPQDATLSIAIALPGGDTLKMRGVVRRSVSFYTEHAYGIELLEISEGDPLRFADLYGLRLEVKRRQAL